MTENHDKKVITRFAPSPTGFMHIGSVRTALYSWLLAKKHNGTFILRIEDTDKEREVSGSIEHIKASLKWLGLDWDLGPDVSNSEGSFIQSERLPIYKKYAEKLIEKGLAYADPYSEQDLEEFRKKAEIAKIPFLYRDHRPANPPAWDGTKPLRFKVTNIKRYVWNDLVWGELSAGPEALDDFVLIKSDGYPTYNFAHIVDDIEMNITHVMRGQEFISSTPKFLSIYDALEVVPPNFGTLPPIMASDGKKKLGKRDGAKDLLDYKQEGYLPEAMINFLALLGWNPGDDREVLTRDDLISSFNLEKVQRSGAQLSEDKLNWLNKEHLKLLSEEERNVQIYSRLKNNPEINTFEKINDEKFISKITPIIFDHISKWGDVDTMVEVGELGYFFKSPNFEPSLLSWKGTSPIETSKKHLQWIFDKLNSAETESFESVEKIKELIFDYATENGRGEVLWPLRVSLSGKEKSPDPFTLIYVLGKEETLHRISNALKL